MVVRATAPAAMFDFSPAPGQPKPELYAELLAAADAITAYGVMWWYPLSARRFGLGATFVVDVWIGAVALGGVLLGLRLRRRAPAAIVMLSVAGPPSRPPTRAPAACAMAVPAARSHRCVPRS